MSYLFYSLILVLCACGSFEQGSHNSKQSNFKMNTTDFQTWVQQTRKKFEKENISPVLLKEKLLERLKHDLYTNDSTVMAIVYAFNGYESRHAGNKQFTQTIELIDSIRPLLHDRALLQSKLMMFKGNILYLKRMDQKAADEYAGAVSLLGPLHLEVDKNRIEGMLAQANISFGMNDKKKAEALCLDILSYPWYHIEEPEYFQQLRDDYIQAGKLLIKCRSGDLEGLKNIFFVPATNQILQPILQKAIKEVSE